MAVYDVDGLAARDVPHDDVVVVARAEEDVLGRRVPFQVHHAASENEGIFVQGWFSLEDIYSIY